MPLGLVVQLVAVPVEAIDFITEVIIDNKSAIANISKTTVQC